VQHVIPVAVRAPLVVPVRVSAATPAPTWVVGYAAALMALILPGHPVSGFHLL
jgi:hypothetical protein